MKGTTALTQKCLLREIEVDLDLFRTTVLFAQGETFNFVDETDKKQKEILGKIVRISFDSVLSEAKEKFKELSTEVEGVDVKVDKLKSRIEASSLKSYQEASKNFDQDKKKEVLDCLDVIKETKEQIQGIGLVDEELINEAIGKMEKEIESCEDFDREVHDKRARINYKYDDVEKKIKLAKSLGPTCDKCGQDVDEKKAKEELKANVVVLKKLKALREKLPDLGANTTKKINFKDKIANLRARLESNLMQKARVESFKGYIESEKKKIVEIKKRPNTWDKQIKEEKDKLKEVLAAIKKIQKSAEKSKDELAYWQFWVNGFGDKGIKSFIFDTICGQLTTRSNYYLGILSNGSMSISFDTQKKLKSGEIREKFEVVVTQNGSDVDYTTFSGGEKRRISLSVDMALADLMKDFYGSDFNIVVFDEQTSYMDKEGRECFMNLLKEQARDKGVFVVDHDAEFKSTFDEVITFKKENGITSLHG